MPGNVSPLKTAVPGPSPASERRRHKRHSSPQLSLTFLGTEHTPVNWSLGGVLVADRHPDVTLGTKVDGILSVRGFDGRFRFSAELVRRDERTKEIAFRFIDPSRALLDALMKITDQP